MRCRQAFALCARDACDKLDRSPIERERDGRSDDADLQAAAQGFRRLRVAITCVPTLAAMLESSQLVSPDYKQVVAIVEVRGDSPWLAFQICRIA